MKTLIDVQDELSVARNMIECAYMACHDLSPDKSGPLCAVLDTASEKLIAINQTIEDIRGGPNAETMR